MRSMTEGVSSEEVQWAVGNGEEIQDTPPSHFVRHLPAGRREGQEIEDSQKHIPVGSGRCLF